MYGVFISIVFLFLLVISKLSHKKWYSGECVFLLLWIVVSLGSLFYHYFGVEEVSTYTWGIVFVGVVSFWVGCNIRTIISIKKKKKSLINGDSPQTNNLNMRYFYILVLISFPFLLRTLSQALMMISSGMSLSMIRASYYGMHGHEQYWNTTAFSFFIDKYFVAPLKLLVTPIALTYCFKRKINWKILLIALFVIVSDVITSGGRFILVYVMVQAAAAFLVTKKKIAITSKVKKIITVIVIVAFCGIAYLTHDRNVGYSLWQGIFEYLCCCIPLLNHYVPQMDMATFGTASLFGFINPILTFTNQIISVVTPYENAMLGVLNTQNAVRLSPSITTNAFVTCFFYPYLDFGWLGLGLGMFVYGKWVGDTDKRINRKLSECNLAIYLLMIQGIIKTIQHMPFSSTSYVLALIYILVFTTEKKKK